MTREEQAKRKEENERLRIDQTRMLVNLFLETNESDIELSKRTGISSSTVGRRLTNQKRILEAFPLNGQEIYELIVQKRKDNLYTGKVMGGQISTLNNVSLKDKEGKFYGNARLRLELFGSSKERQFKFLVHMALTYRTSLSLLSELFQISENVLLESMLSVCTEASYRGLQYLFFHDNYNQSLAMASVLSFCTNLVNARKNKDKELEKFMISQIDDSKVSEIIRRRESGDELSDEEIMTILNYQLKYALSITTVINTTKINRNNYSRRVKILLAKDEELLKRFEDVVAYNSASFGRK